MLRISALTAGRFDPAARFRVRQYVSPLRRLGIDVAEMVPILAKNATFPGVLGKVKPRFLGPLGLGLVGARTLARLPGVIRNHAYGATWLQRELISNFYSFEGVLKHPLIYDIDDAVWLRWSFADRIAKKADVIIAGNRFLADWGSQFCERVNVIPTAIDTARFKPRKVMKRNKAFTIGWTGIRNNLKYLYDIESTLIMFLNKFSDARITVLCDKQPSFSGISSNRVIYKKWSPAIETTVINEFDVGIMPLRNGDWERGKCSFKMLQYMASGIPVVASPVGMNADVFSMGCFGFPATTSSDWFDSLENIYINRSKSKEYGMNGRDCIEKNFEVNKIAQRLASVFHSVCLVS